MKTVLAVEKVVLVRIDAEDLSLHVYMEGFEKPFHIDREDDNHEAYLRQFTSAG